MFSCCFVCCLFVVLGFWYTYVVSNVFLRVPKTESDFDAPRKLSLLLIHVKTKICTTTPCTTTTLVSISIVLVIH